MKIFSCFGAPFTAYIFKSVVYNNPLFTILLVSSLNPFGCLLLFLYGVFFLLYRFTKTVPIRVTSDLP